MNILTKTFFPAIAAIMLAGCMSLTSGEIKIDKEIAVDMLTDDAKKSFAEIKVTWENFPYRSGADKIGTGEIDHETGEFKQQEIHAEPVDPALQEKLLGYAKKIFKKAGLYDRTKGEGVLELRMQSMNRWTYAELLHSYFVETPFILILPRTLPTAYSLTADINTGLEDKTINLAAQNKTHFFFLLAPVYPFLPPSSGEKTILHQMLWRMATEIYEENRKAAQAIKENPGLLQEIIRKKEAEKLKELKKEEEASSGNVSAPSDGGTVIETPDTDAGQTESSPVNTDKKEPAEEESPLPTDFTPTVLMND